ncbi:MAG: DUF11 domain-containing protein, partial [Caldilineaceae bacterium]|nr:DUF11 domain-containing protein [Caldilineaceae bacterium]
GIYTFTNLVPGTYTVTVDVPAGYIVSPQDSGSDDAADSDIDTGGVATPVTLVSGENNPTIDAGLYQLVNVGDTVWFDYNGDGIDTADEPGISGVTVNLLDSLGNVISTTVTGPDGMYLFPDLPPGTYTVAVEPSTLPTGLVNTYDLDGNRDSSATAVVPSGQDNLNFDFGYNAPPQLDATKVDALLADNDNNLAASPGDTLRYTVIITNTGLAPATNVRFNDTPGRYTTLIAGSVTTTQGSVVRGNGNGERQVIVDVGTLAVGAQVTIVFDVRIADTIPADVTHVANQGIVSSSELPETPTDDPDTSTPDDPTLTPIRSEPALVLSKQVTLDVDADNNGVPSPGDTLRYSVTVQSTGNTTALGLVLTDTLDVNTTLIVGSVTTTQGTVQQGNTSGDVNVVVLIGDMAPGVQALVGYNATINDPLP